MSYVKSSHPLEMPPVEKFDLPVTQAQFDALTIEQKSILYQEHPGYYSLFTRPHEKKTLEIIK